LQGTFLAMSRLRRVLRVGAIAVPGAFGCAAVAYRWQNRPKLPAHHLQSLEGRSVVVTGGTSGVGWATVEGLLALGAHVIVGARDAHRGQVLISAMAGEGRVEVLPLELTDPESVATFAEEAMRRIAAATGGIHALVNCAAEIRCTPDKTFGGIDRTFATNQLGPQQLSNCLLPDLLRAAGKQGDAGSEYRPRVVLIGSRLERRGRIDLESLRMHGVPDPALTVHFDPMRNYAATKLANMQLARELHKRLAGSSVDIIVVSPGMVHTGLWAHFPAWYKAITYPVRAACLRSPTEGAAGVLFAIAANEAQGLGHAYLCDGKLIECSEAAKDDASSAALYELCQQLMQTGTQKHY